MTPTANDITQLLADWRQGDHTAFDRLAPLIEDHLQRIARHHLQREHNGLALQPSSLIQEAFLRLLPNNNEWQNRAHFFAVASTVMRHVLVDHARQRRREKRGGGAAHVDVDAAVVLSPQQIDEVVAIDLALQRLAKVDVRKSHVFEMRFFGGLTLEETAEALGVARRTVVRDWEFARAWLRRELREAGRDNGPVAAD